MTDHAKRLGLDGFYATAPGTEARKAEERIAHERGWKLGELKQVEAMGLGAQTRKETQVNEPELEVEEEETVVIAGDNYGTFRVVETSAPYDPEHPDVDGPSTEEVKKFLSSIEGYRPPYGKNGNGKSDAAR